MDHVPGICKRDLDKSEEWHFCIVLTWFRIILTWFRNNVPNGIVVLLLLSLLLLLALPAAPTPQQQLLLLPKIAYVFGSHTVDVACGLLIFHRKVAIERGRSNSKPRLQLIWTWSTYPQTRRFEPTNFVCEPSGVYQCEIDGIPIFGTAFMFPKHETRVGRLTMQTLFNDESSVHFEWLLF